ncbi:MAG: cytochrome-c peroxidase [Gemmatimonadaceae bacterium]|nr:cytochrome-c peroxidase [Gemmatimonadaceae bacterium]
MRAIARTLRRLRRSPFFAVVISVAASTAATTLVAAAAEAHPAGRWTKEERAMLRSLSLASLGPLPADPSNRYADDSAAARLGRALFFDARLSGNGKVACATCHVPASDFQDGLPLGRGVGTAARRTMPIAGTAYSAWQFWDGRADSQWSQALGPLESPVEHGATRAQLAAVLGAAYRAEYESVFGKGTLTRATTGKDGVDRVYANIGKAIAAYERRIGFAPARFDRYVAEELAGGVHSPQGTLSRDEEAGLRIFIGKGSCTNCHNGALLTDQHFHNTGIAAAPGLAVDSGRATGVRRALASEFRCDGPFSDARPDDCAELSFTVTEVPELVRAYKTPSLRNVADRAPYMHAGQLATLGDVVAHYSAAPAAPFGQSELKPLRLSADERRQLEAFLRTLSGPLAAPPGWLEAPAARR